MGHCLIIYSRKNGPPKLIRTTLCGFADRRLGYSAIGGFVRNVRFGGEGGLRSHEPVFHDWHVSTVLPSAGLGDFSIEIGRGYPIRTDGRY